MKISGSTRLACLLGSPVAHSSSPAMHNAAFKELNIDARYLAFEATRETVGVVTEGLIAMNALGFNLTMPLKREIIPYLERISEVSLLCDSVNTVKIEDGKLTGTTTDGIGFFDALLKEEHINMTEKSMVLLGAGGAASAIAAEGALNYLTKLSIFRRKNEKWADTEQFAANLNDRTACEVSLFDIEDESMLKAELEKTDLLCNATSVGMGEDKRSPVKRELLAGVKHVSDIIYHPEETTLLSDAKKEGCGTSNGKYMLLYQGAAAFKIWTGQDMPVDVVKEKIFRR